MNLIQTKRGSERHSNYLEKISELYSVAEYNDMTGDEFQIHLFIELADTQMSKNSTELLGTENPTMQKLKVKVKETENASWYNHRKEYGKMANIRKEKYCKPCNSKTHSESDCWGSCSFCGLRNHQKEYYIGGLASVKVNPELSQNKRYSKCCLLYTSPSPRDS